MTFKSNAASHVGMVRKLNEDSMIEMTDCGVWVVADGMGGHSAGDLASQTIVHLVGQIAPQEDFEDLLEAVKQKIYDANRILLDQHAEIDQNRTPGSTVVALIIKGSAGAVVWAGDSRLYRYREGRLSQLTRDHSHVQDLIDQHVIDEELAESHPMANVITRAVGIFDDLELDSVRIDVREHDQFILCSDGLSRLASSDEIRQSIESGLANGGSVVDGLVRMALDRGAPDNVTVIRVHDQDNNDWLEDTSDTEEMAVPSPGF